MIVKAQDRAEVIGRWFVRRGFQRVSRGTVNLFVEFESRRVEIRPMERVRLPLWLRFCGESRLVRWLDRKCRFVEGSQQAYCHHVPGTTFAFACGDGKISFLD